MGGLVAIVAAASQLATAGPALAGDDVVWGERTRSGALQVVRRSPDGDERVLKRYPRPRRARDAVAFSAVSGGLSASERWVAYGFDDGRCESNGGDAVSCELKAAAFGSRDGGPFRPLVPECKSAAYVSTSSDGDGVAVGLAAANCGGRYATRVFLIEGDAPPRMLYEGAEDLRMRQVELAGPWVAWSTGGSGAGDTRITVAERATGRSVATFRTRDFSGGPGFSAFALDADGNVAALSGPQPRCYYACLAIRNVAGGPARELTRRVSDLSLAMAGGRVAWLSRTGRRRGRVVVAALDGSRRRRFDRFSSRRGPRSEIALSPSRLAWATVEKPYGRESPGAVRSVRLRG